MTFDREAFETFSSLLAGDTGGLAALRAERHHVLDFDVDGIAGADAVPPIL